MTAIAEQFITGDGRSVTLEEIVQCHRDIANLSLPEGGAIQRLSESDFSLVCSFSATDYDTLEKINTRKIYHLKQDPKTKRIASVQSVSPFVATGEILQVSSDNGKFMARLKTSRTPENPKGEQLLEIWEGKKHLRTIKISELEEHGDINTDPMFVRVAWCPFGDQNKLLYVCNAKAPKHTSFFKKVRAKDSKQEPTKRGTEFIKVEDWGESLDGIKHTVVAILDVARDCEIKLIDVDDFSLADAQWFDDGTKIISVAYGEQPRKLGVVYYTNRADKLVVHDVSQDKPVQVLELVDPNLSYSSPRISNRGDKILFLSSIRHGPHARPFSIKLYDIKTGSTRTLGDPTESSTSEFFIESLPARCFSSDDSSIVMLTYDHLFSHIQALNLDSGKLTTLKLPLPGASLLDFRNDLILARGSDTNVAPTMFVATFEENPSWHLLEDCTHFNELTASTHCITGKDSQFLSAIFTTPGRSSAPDKPETDLLPTVVMIHGGPHTNFIVKYEPIAIFFARLGLNVLRVNYRGSTGVSDDYVRSLNGHIGEMDIEDCLEVIRHFVRARAVDAGKLVIWGGSHSGFIACHLSCIDEFKFTSAIIRNPVVNLATLYATSDIPDWCFNQGLGHQNYDPKWIPGSDDIKKLFERSPRADKAHVPTLMLLGSRDRRVNMFQGERWVDSLRARGVETLCKVYPECHNLARQPNVEADSLITIATWVLKHLPRFLAQARRIA